MGSVKTLSGFVLYVPKALWQDLFLGTAKMAPLRRNNPKCKHPKGSSPFKHPYPFWMTSAKYKRKEKAKEKVCRLERKGMDDWIHMYMNIHTNTHVISSFLFSRPEMSIWHTINAGFEPQTTHYRYVHVIAQSTGFWFCVAVECATMSHPSDLSEKESLISHICMYSRYLHICSSHLIASNFQPPHISFTSPHSYISFHHPKREERWLTTDPPNELMFSLKRSTHHAPKQESPWKWPLLDQEAEPAIARFVRNRSHNHSVT